MRNEEEFAKIAQSYLCSISASRLIQIIRTVEKIYSRSETAEKICNRCGVSKARSAFYRDNSANDGLKSHCKRCQIARDSERRKIRNAKNKANYEKGLTKVPDRKRCSGCKQVKTSDNFYTNACSGDGLGGYCHYCQSEYKRDYYLANKR